MNSSGVETHGPSRHHDWIIADPEVSLLEESRSREMKSQMATNSKSVKSDRYKTELCRQFSENGSCRYGDKCQFAHGTVDLRTVSRHPKYKTHLCRTFHSTGFCPYGARCHFIHGDVSRSANPRFNLESMKQNEGSLHSMRVSSCIPVMRDSADSVDRLILGIQSFMNRSIADDSSSHPIRKQRTLVLPPQNHFQYSAQNVLHHAMENYPSTDLMGGSTSVSPTLSCSDSPTPSPTSMLQDGDIWTSLANLIGVVV